MGLNGKAVLPMVLGLGCDTMATMTTRILGTPKERLIAILLLALGIPCSAQLATILGILGGISFAALATLFGVVLGQMFLVGWLAARVLQGERSEFILELPPIRLAAPRQPAHQDAPARVVVSRGSRAAVPRRHRAAVRARPPRCGSPSVGGRPPDRDRAAGPAAGDRADSGRWGSCGATTARPGLFQLAHTGQLTGVQAVVALTVMTLFVPCVANFLMMVRERGLKTGLAILGVITPVAILTGAGLNYVLRTFGVQF